MAVRAFCEEQTKKKNEFIALSLLSFYHLKIQSLEHMASWF